MIAHNIPFLPSLPACRFKRWLAVISAVILTVLSVIGITAPTAQATPTEVTATVFDTPEVRYVNVRSGAGTEYDKIGQINAGETVTLECFDWTYGDDVQGLYSTSRIWYKIKGYNNGWVSDAYLETGSNDPVTVQCDIPWSVSGLELVSAPGDMHWTLMRHYLGNSGKAVKLPWKFFGPADGDFAQQTYQHAIGTTWTYQSSREINGDEVYLSMGKFNVVRTSPNCFRIWDLYDYDWSSAVTASLNIAAQAGTAHEFNIYASGCYTPGSNRH